MSQVPVGYSLAFWQQLSHQPNNRLESVIAEFHQPSFLFLSKAIYSLNQPLGFELSLFYVVVCLSKLNRAEQYERCHTAK
jgi:hypothetical protein